MTSKTQTIERSILFFPAISKQVKAPALVFLVFICAAAALANLNCSACWAVKDMAANHIPQINTFIKRPFDIFDYPSSSATTPGFHIFMAWILRILGYRSADQHNIALRLANFAINSLPILFTFLGAWKLGRDPARAAALTAALTGSSYVIGSAAFVTTDGGALGFFAAIIFILNFYPKSRVWLAIAFAALIAWRQIYLPIAGALGLGGIWGVPLKKMLTLPTLFNAGVVLAPGFLLFAVWAVHWGGVVPPEYRVFNAPGWQPDVLLQALAMTGLLSIVFLPICVSVSRTLRLMTLAYLAIPSFALALVLWICSPTNINEAAGRWGSIIWTLAAHFPSIANHSLIVLPLAWLGTFSLLAAFGHARAKNYFPAEALCLVFYFIGYSAQVLAWQRYVEPQILIFFAFFCSRLPSPKVYPYIMPVLFNLFSTFMLFYSVTRTG
jgi:hypothetical protein